MTSVKTIAISAVAHAALLGGIVALKTSERKHAESIGVMMQEKQKKKDEEEPKPVEVPPEILHQKTTFKAPPKAEAPPPPEAPPPQHAALNAMPDYGINLSGMAGPGGPGIGVGVAVGPGGGSSTPSKLTAAPPKEKNFGTVKEGIQAETPCGEEPIKAKAMGTFNPPYTDDARSAEIEGHVKLKLTIDAQGNVTDVQVLTSPLGHGLEESAIATARHMKFTPASACSKPVSSTFTVGASFRLGE